MGLAQRLAPAQPYDHRGSSPVRKLLNAEESVLGKKLQKKINKVLFS